VVTLADAAADEGQPWLLWILGGLAVWMVVAFLVAVVIGRGIRLADRHAGAADDARPLTTVDLPATMRAPAGEAAPAPRRAIPLPPVGVGLFALAVALETSGYVARLTDASGSIGQLLSMDAPFSLPRMYVAALFGAAALAAVAGAGSIPGRRTWCLAVALVAGGIAAVHARGLSWLSEALGKTGALLVSAAVALAVVGALAFLSRSEQRDRRRVLSALALYAGASVGLSALSAAASSSWAATATFVEESGEALAGVGFLIAVLVGVAPRLVLPASWALRRSADAHTLELPEQLPGRPVDGPARG
jgi:hypothetical protein